MTEPIRRATADDGPACAAILATWLRDTPWINDGPSEAELCDILRAGLPMREAFVIGDPVRGYLSLEAETAHIWGLYVADRGHGLGRALVNQAKAGRDYLRLNTHAANADAHRFYDREGFSTGGAPWRGEDGIDEITMEWQR